MQHAGPNARRAGVGLLHVASETAELPSGGRVSAVGFGGRCWGVAIIVVMVMMANWRCCELRGCSWLAQESGRVVVPHANCAAEGEQARRGSGWPGLRWAVEWPVGE